MTRKEKREATNALVQKEASLLVGAVVGYYRAVKKQRVKEGKSLTYAFHQADVHGQRLIEQRIERRPQDAHIMRRIEAEAKLKLDKIEAEVKLEELKMKHRKEAESMVGKDSRRAVE